MSEWQPIETAPKDGSYVLVWAESGHEFARWFRAGECWIRAEDMQNLWGEDAPTHWMPLPAPPSTDRSPSPATLHKELSATVEATKPDGCGP